MTCVATATRGALSCRALACTHHGPLDTRTPWAHCLPQSNANGAGDPSFSPQWRATDSLRTYAMDQCKGRKAALFWEVGWPTAFLLLLSLLAPVLAFKWRNDAALVLLPLCLVTLTLLLKVSGAGTVSTLEGVMCASHVCHLRRSLSGAARASPTRLRPVLACTDWCEGLSDSDYGGCNLDVETMQPVPTTPTPLGFGGVENFGATLPSCYSPPAGATGKLKGSVQRAVPAHRQGKRMYTHAQLTRFDGGVRAPSAAWDEERFLYQAPGGKCACDQDGNNEDVFFQSLKHNAMLADAGRWMGIMSQVCIHACDWLLVCVCYTHRMPPYAWRVGQIALMVWCIYRQCIRSVQGSPAWSPSLLGDDVDGTAPTPSSYADVRNGDAGDGAGTAPKTSYGSNLA